jgi:hypothetical protein
VAVDIARNTTARSCRLFIAPPESTDPARWPARHARRRRAVILALGRAADRDQPRRIVL